MIRELIGVYNANGGLLGEAAYVWGRLRHTRHCALCDITHSPWRRKPAWDDLAARLPVPFTLLHLNELPADVATLIEEIGAPAVVGRTPDLALVPVLTADELDEVAGDVPAFERLLDARLADH
ncbi:hypothetical protein E8D34_11835 [Nocardioides sp. GY 10113]|uniref:hypothetical protein n=1 Tax=Nocardioides sp. GY 10113 TaxID=2569761 RepID=UPI0010A7BCDD|nr:hypothetical protein [Nocardioides sp. GY 10113]TIC79671.1 hypothetical protein E8D34_20025 [Nocardioides sp. GY 10113]TIC85796.1 hypothetical protein E8D34_11835 [Nocardioides sp. GY 10113]